jgi:prepilin-type N-terminal cleavage/methylation domain-containing protein
MSTPHRAHTPKKEKRLLLWQNYQKGTKTKQGMTLIELLIILVLLGVIVGYAVIGLGTAKYKANETARYGSMQYLNNAAKRADLDNEEGPGTIGTDAEAAIQWYKDKGYIPMEKPIFHTGISVADGHWTED